MRGEELLQLLRTLDHAMNNASSCYSAFEIEIPDEDAEKIRTVQDAVDYIGQHAKGGK